VSAKLEDVVGALGLTEDPEHDGSVDYYLCGCQPPGREGTGELELAVLRSTVSYVTLANMATFAFPIPTTGAIAFSDFLTDPSNNWTVRLSEATSTRATLRGILKQERRTDDHERDARAVVNVSLPTTCLSRLSSLSRTRVI
jgi:hypothetical protein